MDKFAFVMLRIGLAVGVTVGLTVRLIQLVVERLRGRGFSRTVGWRATSAWALGFAIATCAVAAAMSIGIFILPFAVIACGVAAWWCRAFPEGAIGAGLGTGLVLLVIGLMNPGSWLPLAVALAAAAVAGQILMERRKAAN